MYKAHESVFILSPQTITRWKNRSFLVDSATVRPLRVRGKERDRERETACSFSLLLWILTSPSGPVTYFPSVHTDGTLQQSQKSWCPNILIYYATLIETRCRILGQRKGLRVSNED